MEKLLTKIILATFIISTPVLAVSDLDILPQRTAGSVVKSSSKNITLSDQEFIERSMKVIRQKSDKLKAIESYYTKEIGKEAERQVVPLDLVEDISGKFYGVSSVIGKGFDKSPKIVGGASLVGAIAAACFIPVDGGLSLAVAVSSGGVGGAYLASQYVLDEEEFNRAFIRGFNKGVNSLRFNKQQFLSSQHHWNNFQSIANIDGRFRALIAKNGYFQDERVKLRLNCQYF